MESDEPSRLTVLEAIRTRRSVPQYRPDPIPKETIEQLLDTAVWVPNHHLTQPWQFFVLGPEAKARFAELRRDSRKSTMPNPDAPEVQPALQKMYDSTVNTPAILIITSHVDENPETREEDLWATFAATYAVMLGAWSLGIGTYFRTGPIREFPPLREFLKLPEDRRITGVIYMGYPAMVPEKPRIPAAEKTTWLP